MAWAIITIYISKCVQMNPQQLLKTSKFYSRCKKCDIEKTLGGGYHPLGSPKVNLQATKLLIVTSATKLSYRVIYRLIQHCLLSKMVYLNAKYVIATPSYQFFIYTQNLIRNITLYEGYYICSFSKLRHKVHQKV